MNSERSLISLFSEYYPHKNRLYIRKAFENEGLDCEGIWVECIFITYSNFF